MHSNTTMLLPEAIILLDEKANILDVNNVFCELFGCNTEEIIGKNISELQFLSDARKNPDIERLFQHINNGEPLCCELSFTDKNSDEFTGKISVWPLKNENGNPSGTFIIVSNTTEYKNLEKALKESIERETQSYNRGRLEIIDTVLHNIGNAVSSITVGIGTIQDNIGNNKLSSHLNSLANAVKAHQDDFGDYVKNDPQGQKVAPFIIALASEFIKYDERLLKIANRVSDRARHISEIIHIDGIPSKKYCKYTSPRKEIYNTIARLNNLIKNKNVRILVDCDNAPEEVKMPEDQLQQILSDLIMDSIKYIEKLEPSKGLRQNPFIKVKCYTEFDSLVLEIIHNGYSVNKITQGFS